MSIKLTNEQRFELLHNVARLPSTINLRYGINEFQDLIDFSDAETKEFAITIDKQTFKLSSNNEEYTREYDSLPSGVLESMALFIDKYDVESMADNEFVQSAIKSFKFVIDGLVVVDETDGTEPSMDEAELLTENK